MSGRMSVKFGWSIILSSVFSNHQIKRSTKGVILSAEYCKLHFSFPQTVHIQFRKKGLNVLLSMCHSPVPPQYTPAPPNMLNGNICRNQVIVDVTAVTMRMWWCCPHHILPSLQRSSSTRTEGLDLQCETGCLVNTGPTLHNHLLSAIRDQS